VRAATTQVMWGQPLDLQVTQARAGSVAGLFFGSLEQGSWGGLTLPFDLAVVGAPGCHLGIDILFMQFALASLAGTASFGLALPGRPDLLGTTLRFQGFDIDPLANPLGVTTSQPAKVVVCGWERVARIWAPGTTAASGAREVGIAPPMEVIVR
jgi:hypothetical protein